LTAENVTTVTSDHIDPATLDTQAKSGGSTPAVQIFTINGMPNVDPLTLGSANTPINEHNALSIPAYYSGCRFISETIGALPKHVYQKTANGPKRLDSHTAEWTLNSEPNELQTPSVFWSTFLLHAVNWSNAYAALKMIGVEDPQLFLLPPDRVTPFRFNGQQWYAYDLGQTPNANPNSRYLIFAAAEMIHLPALSFDGIAGMPMVKMMAGTLRTTKNTEAYISQYYGQGGLLGGVVESDKPLTKEQVQEYGDVITNKFSGVDKAHKWLVLGNGAKAKTLSPDVDTAQISENRQFGVTEICRMLRIPPHLLYELGRATWANIESLGIEVVKYTLSNWITPLEQELTRKLLTRQERKAGCYIRFDTSALMRGDHQAQIDAAVKRTQNGLTTPDEERSNWELPPYADGIGSRPRVPANTVGLGNDTAAEAVPGLPAAAPAAPPAKQPATPPADVEGSDDLAAVKPEAEAFATKEHLKLSHFEAMIDDAASRVHSKAAKATEAAQKKHKDNPQGWTAWANVFQNEMTHYAAVAVGPIFQTYANLSGKDTTGMADKCGGTYGRQLGQHLMAIGHGQESTAPDLKKVVMSHGGTE